MRNHLGTYECKLCLTLHNNEASYLAHTQGKKHQSNLARRAAKEAADAPVQPAPQKAGVEVKKFVKIGRPGYRVTKQRDPRFVLDQERFDLNLTAVRKEDAGEYFCLVNNKMEGQDLVNLAVVGEDVQTQQRLN